jgi:hypothetical protein
VTRAPIRAIAGALVLAAVALVLGLFTTSEHAHALGVPFLDDIQHVRHDDVVLGQAGDPWQYRVLPDFMLTYMIELARHAGIRTPVRNSFLVFRWLQDTVIFVTAFLYYRKLGLSTGHAALGLSVLAWGISYASFESDLQFSTQFDVLFYLLAGLIILNNKLIWLLPLSLAAALNRETSAFIPLLVLCQGRHDESSWIGRTTVFILALTLWAGTFVAIRLVLPPQSLITLPGHAVGYGLLRYNLLREITWYRLLATVGIVPLVAMAGYHSWPAVLRRFFWVIVPLWCLIHAIAAVMAETRLFLVPHALIFVPGALLFAQAATPRAAIRQNDTAYPGDAPGPRYAR